MKSKIVHKPGAANSDRMSDKTERYTIRYISFLSKFVHKIREQLEQEVIPN